MTIDVDALVAEEADACDARFEACQPDLVAALRRDGVREDGEMRDALAFAHGEYWTERCRLFTRYRDLLSKRSRIGP